MPDRVLLTGISGFIGGHVAVKLLEAGYAVTGSVRDLSKAGKVRDTLARAGADLARLDFVALDLTDDAGWREAMAGMRYLQHTASPFVLETPRDRMDLVRPAVGGTERAVEAALAAGVERIVLTSSMAAIAYGHPVTRTAPFTAEDWTDLDGRPVPAYQQSKTLAERRAWQIMEAAGRRADLVAINPGAVFGPLLDEDPGTSALIVKRLLDGSVPVVPRISLGGVDVRDVAEAHCAAMVRPEAGGRRFPMAERTMSLVDIAALLRRRHPERRVPSRVLPDWIVRLAGLVNRDMRALSGELGHDRRLDSAAATGLLGRPLIALPEAVLATAGSLIEHDLA